jgi:phosphotriesterase-related protein
MSTRRSFILQSAAAVAASAATPSAILAAPRSIAQPPGVVQTVTGPVSADKLGFVLPHEHVCAASAGMWDVWPELFGGRAEFGRKAAEKLKAVKDEGVDTIVDLTTPDLGRNIRLLAEVSRRSGMQIIACTGCWHDPSMSLQSRSVEELTDFFIREIEQGIEGSDIKAGVMKLAADQEGVTPVLEKAFRAGARASKATGVPIETHTYAPKRNGEQEAKIFESEGVDPRRVSLGHTDDSLEMDYMLGLIGRGYTLGMDHLSHGVLAGPPPPGSEPYLWKARADRVKALIDAGHADRIFLSNDWMFGQSVFPTGTLEKLDKNNPDGMLFITRKVIPYLKQAGVSDRAIHEMTVEHPRRFFGHTRD